jgi:hypothetical protein
MCSFICTIYNYLMISIYSRKLLYGFVFIFSIILVFSCSHSKEATTTSQFVALKTDDKLTVYIKTYFKLSEDRALENWYNIYLNKCTTFYKIESPTKDSILNLIRSYWLTSNNQKHEITTIEAKETPTGKEILVTMRYGYFHIATSTTKVIEKLKLIMVLDKKRKILLIREFSRG